MSHPSLRSVSASYRARAAALNTKPWIERALSKLQQWPELSGLFQRCEDLLKLISAEDRKAIEARFDGIVPQKATTWRDEYDEQFREVIVELLGWKWLQEKYPGKSVGFYPRSSKKNVNTPDFGVWDGDILLAAMECKKFNVSEGEKAWLTSEAGTMKSGTIPIQPNLDSASPLAKKLVATIQVAEGQLGSVDLQDNKFIFMSIALDTPQWLGPIKSSIQQFVQGQTRRLKTVGIELIIFEGYWPDQPFT